MIAAEAVAVSAVTADGAFAVEVAAICAPGKAAAKAFGVVAAPGVVAAGVVGVVVGVPLRKFVASNIAWIIRLAMSEPAETGALVVLVVEVPAVASGFVARDVAVPAATGAPFFAGIVAAVAAAFCASPAIVGNFPLCVGETVAGGTIVIVPFVDVVGAVEAVDVAVGVDFVEAFAGVLLDEPPLCCCSTSEKLFV